MAPTISGMLSLPPIGTVDVAVTLEDITRQDGTATMIAMARLSGVEGEVPFLLDVPAFCQDPRRDYTLAARAYREGSAPPLAGTVAVYPWRQEDGHLHTLRLHAFGSEAGEAR